MVVDDVAVGGHAAELVAHVLIGIVLEPAAHVGARQAVLGCRCGLLAALGVGAVESEEAVHLGTPAST